MPTFPFRPSINQLKGYTPGDQPQGEGWVKLNTNENPYPPSKQVITAIKSAASGSLHRYPDPLITNFREEVAQLFDVSPDSVLPANGSDENLTILLRTFVEPGETIAFPYPSYVLYGTLAEIQGAKFEHLPLNKDWSIDREAALPIIQRSKIVFLPNPNSPSGHCWTEEEIQFCVPPNGILVLDEAYGDFRNEPHRGELLKTDWGSRIVITRTLSKSYSLAGIRLGFAIANPEIISGMLKVKDSYNCDSIAQAAGVAAIRDQESMLENRSQILSTRKQLANSLKSLGFDVIPSEANFVWATHVQFSHETLFQKLKHRKILVRFMTFPGSESILGQSCDGLRITVGTNEENDLFTTAISEIIAELS